MSYIDLYKHKQIGLLYDLPIYVAEEDIVGDEFSAKIGSVILGGGGGEHPAIVIEDIEYAKRYYASEEDLIEINFADYGSILFTKLQFFDWTVKNYAEFYQTMKDEGYSDKDRSVEAEIIYSIGKIFYEN